MEPTDYSRHLAKVLRYGASDHSHADFHAKIEEDADEKTPALVYADWLQEHAGQPHAAALIRLHQEQNDFGTHTQPAGTTRTADSGKFRGVLFDTGHDPSVVLVRESAANPNRTLMWHTKFEPTTEGRQQMKQLLKGLHEEGNDLNETGKDYIKD